MPKRKATGSRFGRIKIWALLVLIVAIAVYGWKIYDKYRNPQIRKLAAVKKDANGLPHIPHKALTAEREQLMEQFHFSSDQKQRLREIWGRGRAHTISEKQQRREEIKKIISPH